MFLGPLPLAGLGRWTRSPSGAPPRSTPALCPVRAGGAGPGPLPAPPPLHAGPLPRGPLPPARACSTWPSLLPLPKMGGEHEASLLPSRKREGRRASVFSGARCAGTYSMGQPRRVSTQSSRRQGLWRRPGRRLRKTAEHGPGRRPVRGVRILAPSRRDGPGA